MKRFGLFLTAAIAVMGLMFVTACKSEPDTPPPPPVKFTVTFDKNTTDEVTGVPADQTITKGGKVTAPTTDPVRVGYDLDGWYKEAAATTAWDFGVDTVTADTTLYAKWSFDDENFWLVTFKVKDGATIFTQAVSKELAYVTEPEDNAIYDIIADPTGVKGVWGWYPSDWDEVLTSAQFDFAETEITEDTDILAGLETLFVHGEPVVTQDMFENDVVTITKPAVEGMEGGIYNRFTGGVYLSGGGHQLGHQFIADYRDYDSVEVHFSYEPDGFTTGSNVWVRGQGIQVTIKSYDTHDDVAANAVPDRYPWFNNTVSPVVYSPKNFGYYGGFAWEWNPDNQPDDPESAAAKFTLFLDKVVYTKAPDFPPYVVIGDDAGANTAMTTGAWLTESETGSGIYYVDTGTISMWNIRIFPITVGSDFDITHYTKVSITTDFYSREDSTLQNFNTDTYSDGGVGYRETTPPTDWVDGQWTNPADTWGVIRLLSQATVTINLPAGLTDAPNFGWVKGGNTDTADPPVTGIGTTRIVVKKLVFHN